jgi:hypothetical protein
MKIATLALMAVLTAGAARAEDMPKPICADRPGKGTSPCTVDRGRWQVETDLVDYTRDHGADTTLIAGANLKYGLTDRLDVELNVTPLQTQSQPGQGRQQGFGDLIGRAKIALAAGDNAISLLPWVKLPTAGGGLGNGAVEGGVTLPVSLSLPWGLSLGLTPEIDALKDGGDGRRHVAFALAAGLSRPLTRTFTGTIEVWGQDEEDPSGAVRQASFDLGLGWIPLTNQNLQLDGGVNLGLNRQTPGEQIYVGISKRF